MKFHSLSRPIACLGLAAAVALGLMAASAATAGPAKAEVKSGITLYQNAKATVDASNLADGFLRVSYTGNRAVPIKVQITKDKGTTYTYTLNNNGTPEIFPLTEGDGTYTAKVFENTTGNKYALVQSTSLSLTLRDPFLPFLYPNQYVNFTEDSTTVAKAMELTEGVEGDLAKVSEIYHFVVDNLRYDYDLAASVKSGYLPDVDAVLAAGKGICFDYAALMTAMLRSQNIPCKLVVGYAGEIYHAWIRVYISQVGWVDNLIQFDGKTWSLMDPTFVSSGKGSPTVLNYVGNEDNYTPKYAY